MESDDAPRCCRDSTQFFIFFVRLQALDSFGSASNAIACLYLSSKASPLFIAIPLNSARLIHRAEPSPYACRRRARVGRRGAARSGRAGFKPYERSARPNAAAADLPETGPYHLQVTGFDEARAPAARGPWRAGEGSGCAGGAREEGREAGPERARRRRAETSGTGPIQDTGPP